MSLGVWVMPGEVWVGYGEEFVYGEVVVVERCLWIHPWRYVDAELRAVS